MRNYLGKVDISFIDEKESIGKKGEIAFQKWFENIYQGELLFKQKADRDYKGIDFADEKGNTYQVKTTSRRTYTFNCNLDHLYDHLEAKSYVCIQIIEKDAYIESIYTANEIMEKAKDSYQYPGTSFIWAKDLQQYELEF